MILDNILWYQTISINIIYSIKYNWLSIAIIFKPFFWYNWPSFYPIILSMDEIHVLYDQRNIDEMPGPHTVYSQIKSVISEMVSLSFYAFILWQHRILQNWLFQRRWLPQYMKEIMIIFFQSHSLRFHLTCTSQLYLLNLGKRHCNQ
jgi:hypothetical protein